MRITKAPLVFSLASVFLLVGCQADPTEEEISQAIKTLMLKDAPLKVFCENNLDLQIKLLRTGKKMKTEETWPAKASISYKCKGKVSLEETSTFRISKGEYGDWKAELVDRNRVPR